MSCIIGHNDPVVLPPEADYVHYEGELVIVIGRPARRVTPEEAPHFILGYTCGNDISGEGSRSPDMSNWRKKGSDTFGPVGPWIETDLDPHQVEIITRLNGRETDRGSTSGMTCGCYETVSGISQYVTLHPGDLILTGAPGVEKLLQERFPAIKISWFRKQTYKDVVWDEEREWARGVDGVIGMFGD